MDEITHDLKQTKNAIHGEAIAGTSWSYNKSQQKKDIEYWFNHELDSARAISGQNALLRQVKKFPRKHLRKYWTRPKQRYEQ